ncbi:MAG: DUF1186 domain-containing protein [Candidatus Methanoperedens sp.]|nr:DUF1186 domain-containing protein [Candidatus Methanoperedens sp.]MCE8428969.1 DUF1186 domain-containing protein [Candidatus Methanoperedens sp.]
MAEELENIETIEENDDLEDLIDENTDYYWKEVQKELPEMDTQSLINTMVVLELFVNKTLALEISKRDNAVFHLRKIIQDGDYWGDEGYGKGWAPIHIIHILPLIKNEEALQLLLDILRYRRNDITNRIISELSSLLYHFGENGIKNIIDFTKDETLEPFGRAVAITGLVALAKTHPSYKEEIMRHISDLIEVTDDVIFAGLIADDLAAFQDKSVLPLLKKAFQDGRINNLFIDEEEVVSIVNGKTIFEMERYMVDPLTHFSRENIEELFFEYYTDDEDEETEIRSFLADEAENDEEIYSDTIEPEQQVRQKKVGRNAPCPCGSGKKYKKCCLLKGT